MLKKRVVLEKIPETGLFFERMHKRQKTSTARFIEKIQAHIDYSILSEDQRKELKGKLNDLSSKWMGSSSFLGDCEGKRLVSEMLRKQLSDPVVISVLLDDADHFLDAFNATRQSSPFSFGTLIGFACICGAKKIVIELLKHDEMRTQHSENIVPYAVASGDASFALEVAHFFKTKGQSDPGLVYLYCFGKTSIAEAVTRLLEVKTEDISSSPESQGLNLI